MEIVFEYLAKAVVVIMLIPMYRVFKGPTLYDRLLGANAVGSKTVALVAIIGFAYGRIEMFIDIILAYTILNFMLLLTIGEYFESKTDA